MNQRDNADEKLVSLENQKEKRKLVSLEEHNQSIRRYAFGVGESMPNGIACPNCGAELSDSDPGRALLTNPMQFKVHCNVCNFAGTRF